MQSMRVGQGLVQRLDPGRLPCSFQCGHVAKLTPHFCCWSATSAVSHMRRPAQGLGRLNAPRSFTPADDDPISPFLRPYFFASASL